jgi:hypothetical protein
MHLKKLIKAIIASFLTTLLTTLGTTSAAPYAAGDLVLYFFKEGGTQTIYANLGPAYSYRGTAAGPQDAVKRASILNLNAALEQAYGTGWQSLTNLYVGLAGVYSNSTATTVQQNGDPNRTLYFSMGNNLIDEVGNRTFASSTGMTTAASNIISMNTRFPPDVDFGVVPSEDSFIERQNPFLAPGILGTAFGAFAGGITQVGTSGTLGTFGDVSNVEFALDLHRVVATVAPAGTINGVDADGNPIAIRNSMYEGTVTINSSGVVGFSVIPPATPAEITVTDTLAALNSVVGNASTTTSFTVSGANMKEAITITAPDGFEVSTTSNSGFASNITVGAAGTINTTTIYVRLSASASIGSYNGDITLISGSTAQTIATAASTVSAVAANPVISVSGSLTALNTTYGTASSTSNFTISGANMTAPITVTPPTGFQVSTSPTSGFAGIIDVPASGTLVDNTIIYVRLSPTANAGTYSGNITLNSTGATEKTIATAGSTISKAVQTIDTIASIGSKTFGDAPFAVTAPSSSSSLPVTLSVKSGPATITANTVTLTGAGTVVLAANQAGNADYAAATEVTASFSVSKTTQTIGTFASIGNKSFGDAPFAVTAPTASSGLPVSLSVKSGPATISGNTVTLTGVGTVTLAANEEGNANYNAAAEVTTSFSVSKDSQTIAAFANIGNKTFGDAPFVVTAPTASSGLAVTLSVKSGPATISGNSVTLTGAGTVVLAANQAGNANYNAAAEVTTSFSVSKTPQTIAAFASIGNKTFGDASFAVTAPTASSSLPVTLSVKSGPASISGNTVTLTGAGTVTLAANQAGNDNYNAASEVTTTISISKATPTLTSSPTASPIKKGQNLSQSNLTGGSASAAGASVLGSFAFSNPSTAPEAGNANHSVIFTPQNTSNYNTITFDVSVTVNESSLPALTSPITSSGDCFQPFQYQITATNNPTGFSANNLPEGLSINTGTGLISGTPTKAGAYDVALTITNAAGDFGSMLKITVNKAAQSIAPFTSIGNKAFGEEPFAITAPTASSSSPVTLNVKSGPATISGNTVTLTGVGTVTLAANQAGNDNYNSASEVTTSFSVSKATQTIGTFANIGNKTFGDVPFAVTAPAASSGLAVSLSVKSGPATISDNTVTLTGAGTVEIAANQAGDDNYTGATEVTTSFTVSKGTQTIGAFTSIGTMAFGDAPFVVTAPSSTSSLPVTLSVKSGPATISGNTVTLTGVGTVTLAANQAGNDNFNAASEVTTSFTVLKGAQTIRAFTSIGNKTFGDAPFVVTAPTASSGLPVSLSVNSGPATISGNTVTITGAGTIVLAANQAGNAEYASATESTISISVSKGISTVTLGSLTPTYDGTAKSATSTTSSAITGTVTYTYTGISPTVYAQSSNPPTQAGSYTVVGTINDANYSGNSTGTLVIAQATANITTKPNATNIALGQKLSDSTLSGGIASVIGTFAFTNPNTQPSTVGTSSQSVTFTPADTNNYFTTTTSVDVVTQAGSNPVITTQPNDLTVSQGSSANFSVQATGQNLSYQWKRNGVDISNARSNSYTVSSTSIATAGEYSVVVSSDNGSQPVTSRAAKLIVTFPLADLSINENTSPVLSVSVTGTGLKYQWFKDGMPLRGQTNSTLTLKDITVDQAGTYSVEVNDADGNKFTSQSSKVSVNAVLPVITTQPSNVSVYTAGNATMRVMVKGAGHSYQWKKDGVAIQGEIKNTLSLNDIILSDAGDYTVSVTNSVGIVTSRSARLRVLSSGSGNQGGDTTSPVITTHPTSQTLADGGSETLTVSANGGSLSYQWLKNGTNIAGANEATYKINPASIDKSGNYTVVVYNSSGLVTSNVAKITVNAPEIDVQQPVGSSLTSGTSKISFGTARVRKAGIKRTFIIKNTGNLNLIGLSFAKQGAHSKEYTITRLKRSTFAPSTSATFTVTFKPAATGARTASIRIASNDRDENPFIINLAGEGAR